MVATDADNEARIRQTLVDFGFGSTLPDRNHPVLEHGKVIILGRAPLRIDILTTIDGVEFEEVYGTSRSIELDGLTVPVISPATLLKNKRAAGRPKDLLDILELEAWLRTQS